MTSLYERPSVRIDSGGGRGESVCNPNGEAQDCHLSLAGFRNTKLISIVMSTDDRGFLKFLY